MNKTTLLNIISTKSFIVMNDTKLIKDNPEEFFILQKILFQKKY